MNFMDSYAWIGGLAGGVGLFLLGMGLMTDGLRLAAGLALARILAQSTRTRWHALGLGMLVTALVQSSSAVTVAAIGFVNAGLLQFRQAAWVLLGGNVGTTVTAWLVALVGLQFKVEALALPLIGLGMMLRLTGEGSRRGAVGMALAGFGILFLGIDLLKDTFFGLSDAFQLPGGSGALEVLTLVGIGIMLTVLMQSSSAALAVALTAAQGGMLTAQGAAAVVIGANIGTTVTALMASLGATPNAKRAAAAHIVFNLLTGVVALLLLPWLLNFLAVLRDWLALDAAPAAALAMFHTAFNVLGVLLIWPLMQPLTQFLESRFKTAEEDEGRPRFIDKNALAVPELALDALALELQRLGDMGQSAVRTAFRDVSPLLQRKSLVADRLTSAIATFITQLNRSGMSAESAARLPQLLRVARYYETATELAAEAAAAWAERVSHPAVNVAWQAWREQAQGLLTPWGSDKVPTAQTELQLQAFEAAYQGLKAVLLEAGAQSQLPVVAMDAQLRGASALRRAVQQCMKAQRILVDRSDVS
jgi:phosphate:Na+ symporter